MKVLQLCFAYPPSFSGYGRQLATVNAAIGDVAPDIDIRILTAFDGNRRLTPRMTTRAMCSRSRAEYRNPRLSFHLFFLWIITQVRHFVWADVVHVVRGGPEAMIAVSLARVFGKPVLMKVARNEFEPDEVVFPLARVRRAVSIRADAIVAISGSIRDDLRRLGVADGRIARIPNAVDPGVFRPIEDERREELFAAIVGRPRWTGEKTVVFVGAVSRRKGVGELLSALEALRVTRPVSVLMVGPDYREIDGFEARIAAINAGGAGLEVVYFGERDGAADFMRIADCLVLPSYSEGMPNVVLEALACGLDIVASDIPVNREVLADGLGTTVPVRDAEALAAGLTEALERPIRDFAERRRVAEAALARFGTRAVATRYIDLYRDLCAAAKRTRSVPAG